MTVREAMRAVEVFRRFDGFLHTSDATEVWFESAHMAIRAAAEQKLLAFLDEQDLRELMLAGFRVRAEPLITVEGERRAIEVTPPDHRQLELAFGNVYPFRSRQRRR